MSHSIKISLLAATLALMGAAAYARAENDALAISSAKVSLTQAAATAEAHAHGKASRAEYERNHGKGVFNVEVVSAAKVFDVKVDADTGSVIASTEDKPD